MLCGWEGGCQSGESYLESSTPLLDTRHFQAAVEDSFVFVDVGLWICSPYLLTVCVEMSVYLLTGLSLTPVLVSSISGTTFTALYHHLFFLLNM